MDGNPDQSPSAGTPTEPLLRVVDLTRHFRLGGLFSKKILHAVDDINFSIHEREIVALVGESGCGKTTLARLLAMIYPPTGGDIRYRGRSIRSLRARRDALWYRSEVPMVFQDPYSSMHPVFRVSHGVMRQLQLHRPDERRATSAGRLRGGARGSSDADPRRRTGLDAGRLYPHRSPQHDGGAA